MFRQVAKSSLRSVEPFLKTVAIYTQIPYYVAVFPAYQAHFVKPAGAPETIP